jgi:uncharacterized protein (TIRG00374 family)
MAAGRRGWLVLGILLSLWLLFLMFRDADWRLLVDRLMSVDPALLGAAVMVLAADYVTRLLRWHWMLRLAGSPIDRRHCVRPFFIGFALNNLLPFRAGDIARVVGFREAIGIPGARILGTLIAERFFDLLVLMLILGIGVVFAPVQNGFPIWAGKIALAAGAGLAILVVLVSLLTAISSDTNGRPGWLRRLLGAAAGQRLREGIDQMLAALRLLSDAAAIMWFTLLSLAAWILEGLVFVIVAYALGLDTTGVWLAMAAGNLGTLLPGTPGHLGTFDFFAMQGLMAYRVEHEAAAAFAVLVHVILWVPITLIGLMLVPTAKPGLRKESHELAG